MALRTRRATQRPGYRYPSAGRLWLPGLICAPEAGPDYAVCTGLNDAGCWAREHHRAGLPMSDALSGRASAGSSLRGVLDSRSGSLPRTLTSFVGRDRELAAARRLLEGNRLLTLTGPGGSGKTRLCIELAAEVAAGYPD